MLYIVPTPIGNLKDITLRALEVLQTVDGVICEDTRRTSQLLGHYQINKPFIVLNDYNEQSTLPQIINKLTQGQTLALVSDAGTPLISDPGYKLVQACLESQISVDSLPGPSSILPALTLSGLPSDKFIFLGYLPAKPGKRSDLLQKIKIICNELNFTIIFFIPPHKLEKTIHEINKSLGDINLTLAKELTKIHQNIQTKTTASWLEEFKKSKPKGEFVALLNLKA